MEKHESFNCLSYNIVTISWKIIFAFKLPIGMKKNINKMKNPFKINSLSGSNANLQISFDIVFR